MTITDTNGKRKLKIYVVTVKTSAMAPASTHYVRAYTSTSAEKRALREHVPVVHVGVATQEDLIEIGRSDAQILTVETDG